MNPESKILVDEVCKRFTDELAKRFEEQDRKWDKRISERDDEWSRKLDDLSDAQDKHVATLEKAAETFEEWRLEQEAVVDDIRLEVKKLNKHCERTALEKPSSPGIFAFTGFYIPGT
ncbi:unnamed protein product [Urochloa humidicola]